MKDLLTMMEARIEDNNETFEVFQSTLFSRIDANQAEMTSTFSGHRRQGEGRNTLQSVKIKGDYSTLNGRRRVMC
jgi:hypothetical protein